MSRKGREKIQLVAACRMAKEFRGFPGSLGSELARVCTR